MNERSPRRRTLAVCLIAGSALAACDAMPGSPTATARVKATPTADPTNAVGPTATASPTPIPGLSAVTPAAIPSEPQFGGEAASPDPAFAFGYVVQITTVGFHPNWLVAPCCHPITFINLTSKAISVAGAELPASPAIQPGGSWNWTPPNAESVAYGSRTYPSMTAVIQVNQTSD